MELGSATMYLYILLVLISTVLTVILAYTRRKLRNLKFYDLYLPYFVAGNVIVCIVPFGFVLQAGWGAVWQLAIPFTFAGLVQLIEVTTWASKEAARSEARHDESKKVA